MTLNEIAENLAETLLDMGVPQKTVWAFENAAAHAEEGLNRLPFDQACDVLAALAHSFRSSN
jgi:hypothetical protein